MESYETVINDIISLFEKYGSSDYIGEPITQTEHMIQAAMFAEENKEDLHSILAAFLHDIGHLLEINDSAKYMGKLGIMNHEVIGKEYLLSKGFSHKTASLVENHVKAKRYLVTKFPDYLEKLSPASRETLLHQKGLMNNQEIIEFEADPLFQESLRIRGYDDKAKIIGYKIKPLDYYRELMTEYFAQIEQN